MKAETPMLVITTAFVRKWLLLPISLRIENICRLSAFDPFTFLTDLAAAHILMTCISEYNDW